MRTVIFMLLASSILSYHSKAQTQKKKLFPASPTYQKNNVPAQTVSPKQEVVAPQALPDTNPSQDVTVTRVEIMEDGSYKIIFSDGIVKKYLPNNLLVETQYPDGRVEKQSFHQVQGASPPIPPDQVTNDWLNNTNDDLLAVITRRLINNPASLNNYLKSEENKDIFVKIQHRIGLIKVLNQ